ncbi:MAG: hypothetical protein V1815_00220 [Candidatus Woesearchaeota archaeon]
MGERYYNKVICDVCGRNVNVADILGKCVTCGKTVCKSFLRGCGKKRLFGSVYCKECFYKK